MARRSLVDGQSLTENPSDSYEGRESPSNEAAGDIEACLACSMAGHQPNSNSPA